MCYLLAALACLAYARIRPARAGLAYLAVGLISTVGLIIAVHGSIHGP